MASQGKSVKQHGEDGRVQIAIQNGTSPTASNWEIYLPGQHSIKYESYFVYLPTSAHKSTRLTKTELTTSEKNCDKYSIQIVSYPLHVSAEGIILDAEL
jgi:hypothetical protein